MRVTKVGKRQFAFGLEWNDSFGDDPKEGVLEAVGHDTAALYTVIRKPDGEQLVGYGKLDAPVKGRIYSYAAAVANRQIDGIYVGPTGPDEVWYAVISDGQVVPSTDRLMKAEDAFEAIDVLIRTFETELFVAEGLDGDLFGAHTTFDPIEIVAKSKPKAMKVIGGAGNSLIGAVVLVAVLGGIGFAGWWLFLRSDQVAADPAAQAQMMRDAYLSSVRTALQMPESNVWLITAHQVAGDLFPPSVGGWALEGISCTPAGCSATYALPPDAPGFGISPVYEQFGRDRVSMMADMQSFSVTAPVDTAMLVWDDSEILTPAMTLSPVMDAVGRYRLNFAGASVDGRVVSEQLHMMFPAPPEAQALIKEQLATRADTYLDLIALKGQAVFMGGYGFKGVSLNYSNGHGTIPPAWRMEWVRVHGGEAR